MAGIDYLVKYSCLSDRQRWDVEGFQFDRSGFTARDLETLARLQEIGDGELTGISTGLLSANLLMDVPAERRAEFYNSIVYLNIIVMEEFRHGVAIGSLVNPSFVADFDFLAFSKNSIEESQDKRWNMWELLMALCLSECTNIELYKSIASRADSPVIKDIFTNIMKDEVRHLSAWRDLIKILVNTHPDHRHHFMAAFEAGGNQHNASIGPGYLAGVKSTLGLFLPGSIDRVVDSKFRTLSHIFGDQFPVKKQRIKALHLRGLADSLRG